MLLVNDSLLTFSLRVNGSDAANDSFKKAIR